MGKRITLDEIQAGDEIEVIDRVRVTVKAVNTLARRIDTERHSSFTETLAHWEREFKLAERPLPPLPTGAGSVIEVGGERWFRQDQHGTMGDRWINGFGSFLWPDSMKAQAYAKGGFEVLL